MLSLKKIARFQELIFSWFATNQRDLPWRRTHDPYAVLVSEVMLQQTQVDRVLKYYPVWLDRWPTFGSLATASTADIIRAWAGLGYNRRAVNLQRAARFICDHGGFDEFRTVKNLLTVPSIGSGTAGAVMNFVWNIDTPFLEVNITRILQRLAFGPETVVGWARAQDLLKVAHTVLPKNQARIWPHALMDFGALACRANDPFCDHCPLKSLRPNLDTLRRKQNFSSSLRRQSGMAPDKMSRSKFEETNRYWRGRILDVLRMTSTLSTQKLYEELPQAALLKQARYHQLLADLKRDGLLTITKKRVHLPP